MTVPAKTRRARAGPALHRIAARDGIEARNSVEPRDALPDDRSAILALVDELAILAADLWFAGKLDSFPR